MESLCGLAIETYIQSSCGDDFDENGEMNQCRFSDSVRVLHNLRLGSHRSVTLNDGRVLDAHNTSAVVIHQRGTGFLCRQKFGVRYDARLTCLVQHGSIVNLPILKTAIK